MSATIVTILLALIPLVGAVITAYFSHKSGKAKELEKENEELKNTVEARNDRPRIDSDFRRMFARAKLKAREREKRQ